MRNDAWFCLALLSCPCSQTLVLSWELYIFYRGVMWVHVKVLLLLLLMLPISWWLLRRYCMSRWYHWRALVRFYLIEINFGSGRIGILWRFDWGFLRGILGIRFERVGSEGRLGSKWKLNFIVGLRRESVSRLIYIFMDVLTFQVRYLLEGTPRQMVKGSYWEFVFVFNEELSSCVLLEILQQVQGLAKHFRILSFGWLSFLPSSTWC